MASPDVPPVSVLREKLSLVFNHLESNGCRLDFQKDRRFQEEALVSIPDNDALTPASLFDVLHRLAIKDSALQWSIGTFVEVQNKTTRERLLFTHHMPPATTHQAMKLLEITEEAWKRKRARASMNAVLGIESSVPTANLIRKIVDDPFTAEDLDKIFSFTYPKLVGEFQQEPLQLFYNSWYEKNMDTTNYSRDIVICWQWKERPFPASSQVKRVFATLPEDVPAAKEIRPTPAPIGRYSNHK